MLDNRVDRLANSILVSQEAIRKDFAGMPTKGDVVGSSVFRWLSG